MNPKVKVAKLSIISNTFLTIGKLAVGFSMNSVSVISEAIHSALDLLAAIIAFSAVKISAKPADECHNFGHGKYENVASIIEAMLIVGAAVLIVCKAVPKFSGQVEIENLGIGAAVMAVSALVNYLVSRKLMKVAKETDSPALAGDAWHLLTDVYTSLGVFLGIVAIYFTGLTIIDPIIAIVVALLILKAAYNLIYESMSSILDARLPEEEIRIIHETLKAYSDQIINYHELRTRKSGSERYVDMHLLIPKCRTLVEAHNLCDQIEKDINLRLTNIRVLIHAEPCGAGCFKGNPSINSCKSCKERNKFLQ
ncbi:cation diffusion facilitator family transporter [Desulforamulus reducens MI-1]|uniref:Cation diffusion facilitator family transporter n=1 Tax=Desulforamulus reducens (strain ATCC BAA-1160 / DSM 100696 / MI-1) TaxID=349161 RepID=A4J4P8_DESRM|nr:cation diffusion facilitator family transporter [Desulforamulus reducens]ABO50051.1 cation diffusion facilitator family transporter [Desulforamulus reducens MI-1]